MNNSLPRSIELLSSAIGIDSLIGVILYWLSFRIFDRTPLLSVSAFMIAIGAFLTGMLVWGLARKFPARLPRNGNFVSSVGMFGALIIFIGSVLDLLIDIQGHALNSFPLSQTRSILVIGYALLGIWLVLLNLSVRFHSTWPQHITWLGIITGTIMAAGLFALPRIFIPAISLNHEPLPEIGEWMGSAGWMLFYPIWCIWFGYVCLKDQSGAHHMLE